MSENFPDHWIAAQFDELNRVSSKTLDPSQFKDEVFELYSVPSFPSRKPEFLRGSEIGSTKQVVEPGDVLVCKINPRINRVWRVQPKGSNRQIASSEWIILRVPHLDSVFLQQYFSSPDFRELICADVIGVGGSLTRAQPKRVATFPVPVPPRNEQKRIAAKLDALLARVDACRARLERVPLLLKRFRQAVLAAATSGQLTEGNSHNWQTYALGSLLENGRKCAYGVLKPGHHDPTGVRLLKSGQVRDGYLDLAEDFRITNKLSEEYRRTILKGGEVLLNLVGASIGRSAVAPSSVAGANVSRAIAVIPVRLELAGWVQLVLSSHFGQSQIFKDIGGSAQPVLNLETVREIQIPVPRETDMKEIVRRVETLFAYADRLEARYQQARAEVERLTPALLAKAFRGELVPQDPTDEPAAALLARLQAERATTDAKPRARAKSNPVSALDDPAAPVSPATQREEPAAGLVAITQPDSPPRNQTGATNGHQPAPPDIDDYDRETLLAAIRDVFQQGARYDTDSAIRTISHALGYARTGARIHQRLKNTLRVAVQRGILINEQGEYRLDARSIADYSQDECVAALLASLARGWTEREDAIRAATRYLGFRRTGPALHAAFKSAINGAIRRGLLEYDKELIRKLA